MPRTSATFLCLPPSPSQYLQYATVLQDSRLGVWEAGRRGRSVRVRRVAA